MSLGNKLDSFEPAKRVGTLLEEFKNFAFKGNVVDLAVGVIIGAAFGGIIKSLVDNIVMPLVSLVFPGEKGYENWQIIVASHMDGDKQVIDKSIPYGKFLADLANNEPAREAFKQGEWNTFRIECKGDSIKTWINDVAVTETIDDKTEMTTGFIGLQVHGIKKGTGPYQVRWKNISLRELK